MMLWLIPRYGIYGAAISLLVSTSARLLFVCAGFRVFLKTAPPRLLPAWRDVQMLLGACQFWCGSVPHDCNAQHRPNAFAAPLAHSTGHRMQIFAAFAVMIGIPALCIAGGQAGVLRIVFPLLAWWPEHFFSGVLSPLTWNSYSGFGSSRLFWAEWQISKEGGPWQARWNWRLTLPPAFPPFPCWHPWGVLGVVRRSLMFVRWWRSCTG